MVSSYSNGNGMKKPENQPPKPKLSLSGLLGIAIFFYFSFDVVIGDYDLRGNLLRIFIAFLGLLLPIIVKARREKRETGCGES